MVSSVGLILESSKDNGDDSENSEGTNWGLAFSILVNRGFTHSEILKLSYPQFNAYLREINNPLSFPIMIPYLGGGEEKEEEKFSSREELLSLVADMNKEFA